MIPISDDNPHNITPWVTYGLIAACVGVFLYQIGLKGDAAKLFVFNYGLVPAHLFHGSEIPNNPITTPGVATIFTSMFLHGGFGHLFGNMLYLWIFADNVEHAMGKVRFLIFYVIAGVAAALSQAFLAPESAIPMVGASGAISGVLGAYLLLYPKANIKMLFIFGFFWRSFNVPAMFVLGFWFLMQLLGGASADPNAPGVAFGAHIAGFVAGLVLVKFFIKKDEHLFHRKRSNAWEAEEEKVRTINIPQKIAKERKRSTFNRSEW